MILGLEDEPATDVSATETDSENSLLESLGLSADEDTDDETTDEEPQAETSESAVAASELDSVFGTASEQSTNETTESTDIESTDIDSTDTSELDSLLDSLQNDVQDEPSQDAGSGLGALESRIADAQASLSSEIADDSPATELNSLFDSLETESDETTEPSPAEEATSESTAMENISAAFAGATDEPTVEESPEEAKPKNESVADVLARMNPDGNASWENEDESDSVIAPAMETETTSFAATEETGAFEGEEAEGDGNVDQYMSALLQRLKTGPAAEAPAPKLSLIHISEPTRPY